MKTRAQVFEELIKKVLGQKCELAPMEEEDGVQRDVQGEGTTQPGTASVPANARNRQRA